MADVVTDTFVPSAGVFVPDARQVDTSAHQTQRKSPSGSPAAKPQVWLLDRPRTARQFY